MIIPLDEFINHLKSIPPPNDDGDVKNVRFLERPSIEFRSSVKPELSVFRDIRLTANKKYFNNGENCIRFWEINL